MILVIPIAVMYVHTHIFTWIMFNISGWEDSFFSMARPFERLAPNLQFSFPIHILVWRLVDMLIS